MSRHTADRLIVISAGVVIVALTGAAFWLSYTHLASIAADHGLSGARAWAWPATLDLGIVAGELLMLRAALQGRIDWWAVCLTVLCAGGSIALNVAGVGDGEDARPLDYVVAAVPPTAALIAFGVLMRQLHRWLARPTARPIPAPAKPSICDGGGLGVPQLPAPRRPRPTPRRRPRRARRRSDDEVLTEARELTADWPTPHLTAERIRTALRIAPDRARTLRDVLTEERRDREPAAA